MKYTKPELSTLESAIEMIRGTQMKDSSMQVDQLNLNTIPAYEADE